MEANTVLCLDLSDIRKEYARKMECLAPVHDGSTGQAHAGYWLCAIAGAEVDGSEILPLYRKLYSAEAKDFTGENAAVLSGVDQVRAYTGGPRHRDHGPRRRSQETVGTLAGSAATLRHPFHGKTLRHRQRPSRT